MTDQPPRPGPCQIFVAFDDASERGYGEVWVAEVEDEAAAVRWISDPPDASYRAIMHKNHYVVARHDLDSATAGEVCAFGRVMRTAHKGREIDMAVVTRSAFLVRGVEVPARSIGAPVVYRGDNRTKKPWKGLAYEWEYAWLRPEDWLHAYGTAHNMLIIAYRHFVLPARVFGVALAVCADIARLQTASKSSPLLIAPWGRLQRWASEGSQGNSYEGIEEDLETAEKYKNGMLFGKFTTRSAEALQSAIQAVQDGKRTEHTAGWLVNSMELGLSEYYARMGRPSTPEAIHNDYSLAQQVTAASIRANLPMPEVVLSAIANRSRTAT